jgi:hypothetical protein
MIATFAVGYFLGARGAIRALALAPVRTGCSQIDRSARRRRIGAPDESGNWPMVVTAEARPSVGWLTTLFMTRKEQGGVTCGTFNVSEGLTTVRFSVAYDVDRFDELMLAKYTAPSASKPSFARNGLEASTGSAAVVRDNAACVISIFSARNVRASRSIGSPLGCLGRAAKRSS